MNFLCSQVHYSAQHTAKRVIHDVRNLECAQSQQQLQHLDAHGEDQAKLCAFPHYYLLNIERPHHHPSEWHHQDHILNALGRQLPFSVHRFPDAPAAHYIGQRIHPQVPIQ